MNAFNLLHSGRIGFESRNLSRRAHHFDLHSEALEFRRLLSTGPVPIENSPDPGKAAASELQTTSTAASVSAATLSPPPVNTSAAPVNPVTAVQANPPTNNSSTTNTPGVSPTTPAPSNVVTDDSASVITSASSEITALITESAPITDFSELPAFLVPMPVDPETMELSIETPGLQTTTTPVFLQVANSPVMLRPINSPVGVPTNNSAVGQVNNAPAPAQTQPPTVIQHIGQSLKPENQKPLKPDVAPQRDALPMNDVVDPPKPVAPTEPPKTESPKTEAPKNESPETEPPKNESPKTEPPKTEPPVDATRPPRQPRPGHDTQPVVPKHVPAPDDGHATPEAPAASSPYALRPGMTGLSTLFGVVAIAGGGFQLAMGESKRFSMHWLPRRTAYPRPTRPRF